MIWLILVYYREEEVSSCQDQLGEFRSAASALTKWLEQTNEKVPAVQLSSSVNSLEKDLQIVTVSQKINKKSTIETRVIPVYILSNLTLSAVTEAIHVSLCIWHSRGVCFAIDILYVKCVLIDYSPVLPVLSTILSCFLCQLMTDGWYVFTQDRSASETLCCPAERLFASQDVREKITKVDPEIAQKIKTHRGEIIYFFLFIPFLTCIFRHQLLLLCDMMTCVCLINQGLLDEWTSKDPAVQDLNSKGSALCSLMTFLTSPAKTKAPNKSGNHQHTSHVWINPWNGKHGIWVHFWVLYTP